MEFSEFVATIRADRAPELKDFERLSVFVHAADKDTLWEALGHAGIHPIYRNLLTQALHLWVIEEERERERERQRKYEEAARLDIDKDLPPHPRRRAR
jgi:hypothetical protein